MINNNTIRHDVFLHFYNLLSSSTVVSSTVTVTGSFIDDDKKLPQIVIRPVNVDMSRFTMPGKPVYRNITVVFDIVTTKSKEIDLFPDALDVVLNTPPAGLMKTSQFESASFTPDNTNRVYQKSITVNYRK